jgi:hypothetical protein
MLERETDNAPRQPSSVPIALCQRITVSFEGGRQLEAADVCPRERSLQQSLPSNVIDVSRCWKPVSGLEALDSGCRISPVYAISSLGIEVCGEQGLLG